MRPATRLIGLVCLMPLAAGCSDSARLSGPRLGLPSFLAGGSSNAVRFYSTYLGGAGDDDGRAIAVDANGSAYVTGETASLDFPTTAGAFRGTGAGLNDVFVTKLDPSGGGLVYSTYLGGTRNENGLSIAVDANGSAYVAGRTASTDFPTTPGAFQAGWPAQGGNTFVAFVTKLDPAGSALVYSTYLGGAGGDDADAIAVDGAGNAYVAGEASSTAFPITVGAFQASIRGQTDAFVTKLNASGSALVYSTYLGGGSAERASGIAVDGGGYAYVTGRTTSGDFPTTAGAFQTTKASGSTSHAAFVTKLDPSGSALAYSTYLAGTGSDRGSAIALNFGNAYVAGLASSVDFPTTPGAFQTAAGGGDDAFVAKLNASGSALVYSTYLGGAGDDENEGIAIDTSGSAYVAGLTASINFPTTAGAIQPTQAGGDEGFVAKLDPTGSTLAYSTYLGGTGDDESTGLAIDAAGSVYLVGSTESADFPTTPGAFDGTHGGGVELDDLFVMKLADFGQPATLALAPGAAASPMNTQHCVTATVQDAASNPVPGVVVRFSVTGAHSLGGSVATNGSGQATFCYTGTQGGDDAILGVVDTNGNGVQDAGEPSSTATKTWSVPATLALASGAARSAVNSQHCVAATVQDAAASPVPGVTVRFTVTGAHTAAGTATTDASGRAPFCYTGTQPGVDTITGLGDANGNGVQDAGEPSSTATKTWSVPATLALAPAAARSAVNTQHCVTATVQDTAMNPLLGATVRFTATGVNSASGSATTDASGQAPFCYTGTQGGDDTITGLADTNGNGVQDAGEPSGTASKTWAVPAALALAPATASSPMNTQHCVTATVQDAAMNPVPGATVRFTVTGVNSAGGAATTDASGQAPFCYTGTQGGDDTITGLADTNGNGVQDFGEPSNTASKTWTVPASLALAPATATSPMNTQHCVAATVQDAAATPVPGVTVRFSVSGAHTAAGAAATDASGQAPFCYTGTQGGDDAITGLADTNGNGVQDTGEPISTASKTWTVPATLALAPSATTSPMNTQHCVTATVQDAAATPVPGVTVRFSVSGAHTAAGTATTDASGQAPFCYTGTQGGDDTITGVGDTNGNGVQDVGEPSGTATKTWTVPATLALAPSAATSAVNRQHCVTATVQDAAATPVRGVTVRFSVSGAHTAAGAAATDASGQAPFCYTGTQGGDDTITGLADTNADSVQNAGEPSGTATKTWAVPATLALAPATASSPMNTQHCVTATVRDGGMNPVLGATVRFTVTGVHTTGGSATTDASGQAPFCFTGTQGGDDTITGVGDTNGNGIQDAGEPSSTATKTWTVPATLALAPGAATSAVNNQHCVTATVQDAAATPVPGVTVRFSVTGAHTTAGAATTDASGQAPFCYTGTQGGDDMITGLGDTNGNGIQDAGEPSGTASKTWTVPATLALAPSAATSVVNSQHCVTATVQDAATNPVLGATVRFTVTGVHSTGGSATTDANGQAPFCYTGTQVGDDTITAFADTNASGVQDPSEPSGTATKTWVVAT